MLSALVGHGGELTGWHDLWSAWNPDPAIMGGLAAAAVLYQRGSLRTSRPPGRRRSRCFWAALGAVAIALLSPLDALSGELASAHMVQHVLLVLVAAPLAALSAPVATILLGSPVALRRTVVGLRRRTAGHDAWVPAAVTAAVWLLHAGTLWFWHASVPYGATLEHELVHATEHATFLLTAVLFWSSVVRSARSRRASGGVGVMLVFTMGMQGVVLALLMTFATSPWYDGYRDTTSAWGLHPLDDQQLAGGIMWVPAGFVYIGAGIALVVHWIRATEHRVRGAGVDWSDWDVGAIVGDDRSSAPP